MWNYNIDEMPKDGSEIVVWFVSDSLINETEEYETFVLTLLYHKGRWLKKISQTECEDIEYAKCWALAPKKSESDSETNKPKYTVRGFVYYRFKDYNGNECTLQESSLADEYCVWLGREKNQEPHHATGLEMSPRMHLTQSQAKWLGEKLIKFAETGDLLDDNQKDNIGSKCSVNNHFEVIGK